jgi:hypothetical protein
VSTMSATCTPRDTHRDVYASLVKLIDAGDVGGLLWDLTMGALPNSVDERGWTPLMHAAAVGSVGAIGALLDAGARVDARNHVGGWGGVW